MVTANSSEIMQSGVSFFMGTAGAAATTPVGHILEEDTVTCSCDVPDWGPIRVHGKKSPTRHIQPTRDLVVTCPAAQINEDLMALALGITKDSNIVNIGDSDDTMLVPQFSFRMQAKNVAGETVQLDIPYASNKGTFSFDLSPTGFSKIPLEIHTEDYDSNPDCYWTFPDLSKTIATGSITPTEYFHYLKGESGTTDVLTAIVGSGYSTNDIIVLAPYTTSYIITITHAASGGDVPILMDEANWLFGGSLDDRLYIKWNGTDWEEIGRYDA